MIVWKGEQSHSVPDTHLPGALCDCAIEHLGRRAM
jgi:hypothetical protein